MGDKNTESSATMRIPRLCGRTHEGPIYRRPNVGCPSSEVNRQRAQAQNHSSKGETTRSGRSRQNVRGNHVRESANENSKKYTAGAG